MPEQLLKLENIYKNFGNVKVLKDVNITINKGEVVALIGDNGAGKSTLIKVITGVHTPNSGKIFFKEKEVQIKSVSQSRKMGIEAVYQERALCDQQELYRNIFAGREITNSFGFLKIKDQRKEAEKILRDYIGFTSKAITVDSTVMGLSGGEKGIHRRDQTGSARDGRRGVSRGIHACDHARMGGSWGSRTDGHCP